MHRKKKKKKITIKKKNRRAVAISTRQAGSALMEETPGLCLKKKTKNK